MALFLTESDVKQILTMPMALEGVEAAHRALSRGEALDTPRERTRTPKTVLHILQGALLTEGVLGYKAYTSNREGVRFLVYLFSIEHGHLDAVLEADYLGMTRTGAAGGVAANLLANADASVVGLFGSGWQAEGQLRALAAVRKLREVKVFARKQDKLVEFCKRMAEELSLDVRPAASAEETVKGSHIVVTITTAAAPLFDGNWLEPGTHINAAGSNALIRQEIDETAVKRASVIAVDSRATALKEAGDLFPLLEKGRMTTNQWTELGDLLIGTKPGRTSREAITLFESQGMAIQDLAVAARIVAKAREMKLGSELPLAR